MADSGQEVLEVIDGQFDSSHGHSKVRNGRVETLRQIMALHGDVINTGGIHCPCPGQGRDAYKSQGFLDVLTKPADRHFEILPQPIRWNKQVEPDCITLLHDSLKYGFFAIICTHVTALLVIGALALVAHVAGKEQSRSPRF